MYKNIAKGYNNLHKEEQLRKLEIIRKYIKIIPPLLDIGCGTGISTNYFGIEATGIDNCKEMIAEGNVKGLKDFNIGSSSMNLEPKKHYKNLIYGKAEHLPFKDKSFNTIISVTAFHNFKNMEKALQEIKRVSRNNNIAISFLKKSKKLEEFRKILSKYYKFKEIEEEKDIMFIIKN